jgi:Trk K+ transport system NAD-binding subunit
MNMSSIVRKALARFRPQRGDRSLAEHRFLVHGDGRLVMAVAETLAGRGAEVHHVPSAQRVRDALTKRIGKQPSCVLALDDHHEKNLRAALEVSEVNVEKDRQVPVVVRAFDPQLADEIERERPKVPFRVRGAFSVANLAAPDFVVAALVDKGEENLVTLRLGDQYVNVCRLRVCAADDGARRKRRRPLLGGTPEKLISDHGCRVLARRRLGDPEWKLAGNTPLEADEEVIVGGQLLEVLRLVRRQSAGGPSVLPHRPAGSHRRRDALRSAEAHVRRAVSHAGMPSTWFLIVLFILITAAVLFFRVDSLSKGFYLWVLTATGSPPSSADVKNPDPVVTAMGLLAGGLALGLGISLMSAYFTRLRMYETIRRRARRLRHHVVIVGLGDVGLRISQLLSELGVDCGVIDTSTSAEAERRRAHANGVPVISADLEAGLPLVRIERAFSLIATSEDNLLNVEACLRAKRERGAHVRTIARIFDDVIAGHGREVFGVDDQISAAEVAAPTFVDAALHEHCLRTIDLEGCPMAALRWPDGNPVGSRQMARWREDGVSLLAVWRRGDRDAARPDPEALSIEEEQAAILVGPRDAMKRVLLELQSRTVLTAA